MAELYVAIYQADEHDVPHWSLASRDDNGVSVIYEAVGISGSRFSYYTRHEDFEKSATLEKTQRIGRVEADVWPEVAGIFAGVPTSSRAGWNCQNWVVEAVRQLRERSYLEEDEAGLAYIGTMFQRKWADYRIGIDG